MGHPIGVLTIGLSSCVISNIGACVPGITGTIALLAGYHTAFFACAIFSLIGSVFFVLSESEMSPAAQAIVGLE